jgi:hypothetical protein
MAPGTKRVFDLMTAPIFPRPPYFPTLGTEQNLINKNAEPADRNMSKETPDLYFGTVNT